tara:strand:- start:2452 stop:2715 length:264 start_codon:yes stop_codon:yes gene_type:complete
MDRKIMEEHIVKINPNALFADGYDRSIKGIGFRDDIPVVLYSSEKCIQQLMEDNDWCDEDSLEWFEFNTLGSYVGKNTPMFEWSCIC